jgi:hypothetical protein
LSTGQGILEKPYWQADHSASGGRHTASWQPTFDLILQPADAVYIKPVTRGCAFGLTSHKSGFLQYLEMPADRSLGQRCRRNDLVGQAGLTFSQGLNDVKALRVAQRLKHPNQASFISCEWVPLLAAHPDRYPFVIATCSISMTLEQPPRYHLVLTDSVL